MTYSEAYYEAYKGLPEALEKSYHKLNFDNHCYLRIALDNTFNAKWDNVIKRPAYKNLSKEKLERVVGLLQAYKTDLELLQSHNAKSLSWRKKLKTNTLN
ncbi:acetyltransferase [Winogradskyella maritima]|uniref:Acetyltransferase n=1 Tax=Winogradskyella maritima TaxID=1517766 RepID=A0ABV8AIY4_9FLAO|nr:acetyltransferase [Winogradskyella maritima]